LSRFVVESDSGDDDFAFAGFGVALTFRNLPREDDVFEIKDGEVIIFKLLDGVGGNNVIQRADQVTKLADCRVWHAADVMSAAILLALVQRVCGLGVLLWWGLWPGLCRKASAVCLFCSTKAE